MFDGLLHRFVHLEKIIAVNHNARHRVTRRAVRDILDAHLFSRRRRVRVLIVFDNKNHRHVKYARPIQRLVRETFTARTVAKKIHCHARLLFQFERVRRAHRNGQRLRQMTHKADDAERQIAVAVHVDIAPATRSRRASEKLRHQTFRRHAARQVRAQVAVQRRNHILRTQRQRRADANRFVSALRKKSAHEFALFEQKIEAVVKRARKPHPVMRAREQFV
ncbi:MAG: hypothetical protein HDKAJFGB_03762 [Anaerolineae bacterium]|nr:hypothetical protein [Anaerolineae bacterium]